jgi:hypothetical protein
MYGNIGTPDRLEFSVIGQAANEAARIEGMSKILGVPLVLFREPGGRAAPLNCGIEGWMGVGGAARNCDLDTAWRGRGAETRL